jgi:hypothetical protein
MMRFLETIQFKKKCVLVVIKGQTLLEDQVDQEMWRKASFKATIILVARVTMKLHSLGQNGVLAKSLPLM